MHTPRHFSGRRRLLSMPRRNGRTEVLAAEAAAIRWLPMDPPPVALGDQARRELAAMAARRQDPWAGTRDTDRQEA